jgi:hypothetical protein
VPKLLSQIFTLLRRVTPLEHLIAVILLVWGAVAGIRAGSWAPTAELGTGALLLYLLSLAAKSAHYVVFEPEPAGLHAAVVAIPAVCRGVAAGLFYDRHGFPRLLSHVGVQVRWYGKVRPPELVVLTPAGLEVRNFNEMEADYLVRWYPGAEVTRGTLWMGGRALPGLRLRFVGRALYLGMESEETADALAGALDLERYVGAGRVSG